MFIIYSHFAPRLLFGSFEYFIWRDLNQDTTKLDLLDGQIISVPCKIR